jgi:REP element-mobilizing transposase RayT
MPNIEADTEKQTAPPEEGKSRPGRLASIFERPSERAPEVDEVTDHARTDQGDHDADIIFEPVERQPYIISYVCVLIPRFDSHFLQGDVVAFLEGWMKDIAVSWGWKLDWTDIQSQYLQWMLSVPVSVPPAQFIRVIRQVTSRKIMADFPHYTRENLSNDFWASGFLISVGRRPHPLTAINEFIRLTRQQQGIFPSRPR